MHCFVSGECACACECCQCTSECSCSTTTNAGDGIQTTPSSYVVASSRPDPASDFVSTMPLPFACSGPSSYSVPDPFRQDRGGDDAFDWGGVGQDQVHRTSGLSPRALQSSIIPSNCTIGNGSTTTTQLGHQAGGPRTLCPDISRTLWPGSAFARAFGHLLDRPRLPCACAGK